MLWHNNPSPSILMVNVTGSPEEPTDTPGAGKQRLFVRDSDGHLCRIDENGTVTDLETAPNSSAAVLLDTQAPSGTGTVTFSSFSSAYRDLKIVVRGAGTVVATSVDMTVKFNSDGGANYDSIKLNNTSATAAGATQLIGGTAITGVWSLSGSLAPANTSSYAELVIFEYAGTTFKKTGSSLNGVKLADSTGNIFTVSGSFWWRSTAAITQIDLILASGNFTAGTTVSLYGLL